MLVCFHCSPKVDSPSQKTTKAAFQWFRFRSSCMLMNLPLLDIMLLTRNTHRAETQHPIDRPENIPITSWHDLQNMWHMPSASAGHQDYYYHCTYMCQSLMVKICHVSWLFGSLLNLCRWPVSSLGAFTVSLSVQLHLNAQTHIQSFLAAFLFFVFTFCFYQTVQVEWFFSEIWQQTKKYEKH